MPLVSAACKSEKNDSKDTPGNNNGGNNNSTPAVQPTPVVTDKIKAEENKYSKFTSASQPVSALIEKIKQPMAKTEDAQLASSTHTNILNSVIKASPVYNEIIGLIQLPKAEVVKLSDSDLDAKVQMIKAKGQELENQLKEAYKAQIKALKDSLDKKWKENAENKKLIEIVEESGSLKALSMYNKSLKHDEQIKVIDTLALNALKEIANTVVYYVDLADKLAREYATSPRKAIEAPLVEAIKNYEKLQKDLELKLPEYASPAVKVSYSGVGAAMEQVAEYKAFKAKQSDINNAKETIDSFSPDKVTQLTNELKELKQKAEEKVAARLVELFKAQKEALNAPFSDQLPATLKVIATSQNADKALSYLDKLEKLTKTDEELSALDIKAKKELALEATSYYQKAQLALSNKLFNPKVEKELNDATEAFKALIKKVEDLISILDAQTEKPASLEMVKVKVKSAKELETNDDRTKEWMTAVSNDLEELAAKLSKEASQLRIQQLFASVDKALEKIESEKVLPESRINELKAKRTELENESTTDIQAFLSKPASEIFVKSIEIRKTFLNLIKPELNALLDSFVNKSVEIAKKLKEKQPDNQIAKQVIDLFGENGSQKENIKRAQNFNNFIIGQDWEKFVLVVDQIKKQFTYTYIMTQQLGEEKAAESTAK
ncbi:hypothetical protein [Mycoplasma nasistruthionis]|uniref:Uncharacterized protein n=1 Tax=Mycoplasma nasistruthionis TaxID=353852 RepID=A0A5B7XV78_9MOLU|nr:hypothetical protein [Mycoplasma nasistruthionis]QCZ36652.1 hypothetical protein FG904_01290 [Mycoplasma nasistruthionis]